MHRREGKLIVSATDLVGFLECGHLTNLELQADAGLIHKPSQREDPEVLLLQRRGGQHEERYIEDLRSRGREVTALASDWTRSYEERGAETTELMRHGADVIYQATVFDGRWVGHPDFLLRVEGRPLSVSRLRRSGIDVTDSPAGVGSAAGVGEEGVGEAAGVASAGVGLGHDWHYEVADTKLAHSAKASALIQICSYVDQVERIQGVRPDHVYVVTGGKELKEHAFRTAELMAYFRHAKARFEAAVEAGANAQATYPDPVEHCSVCKWYGDYCWRQWRDDDALPLVAGISRAQRKLLTGHNVATRGALAQLAKPFELGLKRAQDESMWKVREQARLQVESTRAGKTVYELLQPEQDSNANVVGDRGLSALPAPDEGDLFFDIEGDPFAFWEGLEYLFGVWERPNQLWDDGYTGFWALDREAEKSAFEAVIDMFMERWRLFPNMHIYHYAPYEPSALKRLAGRHATREKELDRLLSGRVFVDLYRVVRQGVRVGAESYSIKKLEPLYGYEREIELRDANSSIVEFESVLEVGDPDGTTREQIRLYNRDDCVSTEKLRDWLEQRRFEAERQFSVALPRPRVSDESTVPKPDSEWELRLKPVLAALTQGIVDDPRQQSETDKTRWLLANLLDWHRREDKASWWRFFELLGLTDEELFDEPEPIARLRYEGVVETKDNGKAVHRYSFPPQEHKVGDRSELYDPRKPLFKEAKLGSFVIDKNNLTLAVTQPQEWDPRQLTAVVPKDRIRIDDLQSSLLRVGEWVAQHDLDSPVESFRAVRDLLRRTPPRVNDAATTIELYDASETGAAAAQRLACSLSGTTLGIQGPPGSGKTYSGARMVVEMIRDNRRVGITGSSHKVIVNFLNEIWGAAAEEKVPIEALERIDPSDSEPRPWHTAKDNKKFDKLLASDETNINVVAGTVWLWSRQEMLGSVDTLFVDEAGQVSLANVIASGGAARNIVLLGDPQQLDQVLQGSHPPGAEKSSLSHYLGEDETIPRNRGVFLGETWRMHPQITHFTSELFYESKLTSVPGLERQRVDARREIDGSGLRWVPVEHDGNTNSSVEEAEVVCRIWNELVGQRWLDRQGVERALDAAEIVIVSPFNAHRLLIQEKLGPSARVGTVDKFQGQEAAVSIYTMATSRPEDAPRGVDFLLALNRLNVATSRAQALTIVVASPRLLDFVPRTPDQLRMANGLSAFVEEAASEPR